VQTHGQRPGRAGAEAATVGLDDWDDAAGGGAEEGFVGDVEIVRRQVALGGGDAQPGGDLEDGLAGDAL
jgi:hypothetical protein